MANDPIKSRDSCFYIHYLYVPNQCRIPISQIRNRLRRLHIFSSHTFDIIIRTVTLLLCLFATIMNLSSIHNYYSWHDPFDLQICVIQYASSGVIKFDYVFVTFACWLIHAIRRISVPVQRTATLFFIEEGFFAPEAFLKIFHICHE
ncbi:hypothetical protein BCV72DRAFT_65837 [Rhizopus microsporus var. microsporus]|uniref:Uncharacterized protein n=2 Tax=Rhizopus microsporus TaxID=58291 RepID=A0A2G4T298_RHIZD|nr:uncharacterized protein RHIMIDRAFT_234517 [Rhizopus microsporus ATCC 52813]ORE01788.1 hypothetical protein BCV72DRAFT_65837 [Rhizopus microsporus var. microsporus]PHZ15150.1 hypothetical protein RHIMIDRAFT_234517 [Rhizopus microsporus ATCC 52813]